jgi:hypothetical protein
VSHGRGKRARRSRARRSCLRELPQIGLRQRRAGARFSRWIEPGGPRPARPDPLPHVPFRDAEDVPGGALGGTPASRSLEAAARLQHVPCHGGAPVERGQRLVPPVSRQDRGARARHGRCGVPVLPLILGAEPRRPCDGRERVRDLPLPGCGGPTRRVDPLDHVREHPWQRERMPTLPPSALAEPGHPQTWRRLRCLSSTHSGPDQGVGNRRAPRLRNVSRGARSQAEDTRSLRALPHHEAWRHDRQEPFGAARRLLGLSQTSLVRRSRVAVRRLSRSRKEQARFMAELAPCRLSQLPHRPRGERARRGLSRLSPSPKRTRPQGLHDLPRSPPRQVRSLALRQMPRAGGRSGSACQGGTAPRMCFLSRPARGSARPIDLRQMPRAASRARSNHVRCAAPGMHIVSRRPPVRRRRGTLHRLPRRGEDGAAQAGLHDLPCAARTTHPRSRSLPEVPHQGGNARGQACGMHELPRPASGCQAGASLRRLPCTAGFRNRGVDAFVPQGLRELPRSPRPWRTQSMRRVPRANCGHSPRAGTHVLGMPRAAPSAVGKAGHLCDLPQVAGRRRLRPDQDAYPMPRVPQTARGRTPELHRLPQEPARGRPHACRTRKVPRVPRHAQCPGAGPGQMPELPQGQNRPLRQRRAVHFVPPVPLTPFAPCIRSFAG